MSDQPAARRIRVAGQVQGVGFRPYIYRLAHQFELTGSVCNQLGQVEIIVQGAPSRLVGFEAALLERSPLIAKPRIVSSESLPVESRSQFTILASKSRGEASVQVPVDFFTCSDCLQELNDPGNRRYAYPFINCTQCGPRYTLIKALPYDRPNTSMAGYVLCDECKKEYEAPLSRRFHAEPIACPMCGPALRFESATVKSGQADSPLKQAAQALKNGQIVAVKGIGGYHLMCDARDEVTVKRLRSSKHRPHKPLAVMFAARSNREGSGLLTAVEVSGAEWDRLNRPDRPIVLLRKQGDGYLAESIAPGLNEIGVMLAYSPIHDLLLSEFGGPLVATSGNVSGEPVITSSAMANKRLECMVDGFLHHNRPIVRPADDSVLRFISGRPRTIRLGRGLAPLELELPYRLPEPVLALGGHMKVTVALAWEKRVVVSPHIGEMGSPRSLEVLQQVLEDLQALHKVSVKQIVCDAHPGYTSHRWALKQNLPVTSVWHHHAHASSLGLEPMIAASSQAEMLVFTWDGVGWGPDETLWGGEALLGRPGNWQRFAHWRPFKVPGGDRAGREPWRSAAALCWSMGIDTPRLDAVSQNAMDVLYTAWCNGVNAPQTTAVGRLFDGASELLGVVKKASFEGQGPMYLEALAEGASGTAVILPVKYSPRDRVYQIDWAPLILHMLDDKLSQVKRAADWHESMAQILLMVSKLARKEYGIERIGLSGGVFQNRILSERGIYLLKKHGFDCQFSGQVPMNDGGLCVGQIVEYLYQQNLG